VNGAGTGISNWLINQCTQTAVYWGNPTSDGYGHHLFDPPVEIPCRWQDSTIEVATSNGESQTSRAVVYLLQDVQNEGMLMLGNIADLTEDQIITPKNIADAWIIIKFDKTPYLRDNTVFLRKAYL
jgi:hypothetical protein